MPWSHVCFDLARPRRHRWPLAQRVGLAAVLICHMCALPVAPRRTECAQVVPYVHCSQPDRMCTPVASHVGQRYVHELRLSHSETHPTVGGFAAHIHQLTKDSSIRACHAYAWQPPYAAGGLAHKCAPRPLKTTATLRHIRVERTALISQKPELILVAVYTY